MGVKFMLANRQRARGLGGRELTLSEAKAVRTVLEKMGRLSAAETAAMDADIHRMEASQLLADLDSLLCSTEATITKLQLRPTARLSRDELVHIRAWLERIELLQTDHRDLLHVGHLLQSGGGADPVLRELNLAFLHLVALVNLEDHIRRNLVDPDTTLPLPQFLKAIAEMEQREPLAGHLATAGYGMSRMLGDLPSTHTQRARVLRVYGDYVELSVIANAFTADGSMELPLTLGAGHFPGYQELMRMPDPLSFPAILLEGLNERLDSHLETSRVPA